MTSPQDPHSKVYNHVRGTREDLLDRLAVSELCKGWPVYRDSSEWKNYRNLFADDAYVWTTWSKRLPIDDFIATSKRGKEAGDFISHRECGTLVELGQGPNRNRAVGKMKATITQRFRISQSIFRDVPLVSKFPPAPSIEFDVDCDCRFHFFCERDQYDGQWRTKYVKLIYEKDKVVPVDGTSAVSLAQFFPPDVLAKYPAGYKYLGAAQALLGHEIDPSLPTLKDVQGTWLPLYRKMEEWLDGAKDIDLVGNEPPRKTLAKL